MVKIGTVILENNIIQAPLAGISHLPFRLLSKECGCGLVCSEMISANGIIHRSKNTLILLNTKEEEKPLSVQIFGSDPSIMADAAQIVELSGADIIDINFGCSVKKIVKTGAGVALMKEPVKAAEVIKAVKKSISVPLTIKIRSGWEQSGKQAFYIANIAKDCGVDAITVHPRTATQGFRGKSDWSVIAQIKRDISIPVIGNGDICVPEDALNMIKETGCDAVMIGRGSIGNPWLFSQTRALLNGEENQAISIFKRFELIKKYIDMVTSSFGEKRGCYMMRGQLGWFIKGFPNSSKFRESLHKISNKDDAVKLVSDFLFLNHV